MPWDVSAGAVPLGGDCAAQGGTGPPPAPPWASSPSWRIKESRLLAPRSLRPPPGSVPREQRGQRAGGSQRNRRPEGQQSPGLPSSLAIMKFILGVILELPFAGHIVLQNVLEGYCQSSRL